MKRGKKKYIVASVLAVLILGIIAFVFIEKHIIYSCGMSSDAILLRYGDNFENILCKSLNKNKDTIINENRYNIVFYIDPYCESCLESFVVAAQINDVLGNYLDVKIIWRQEPSEDIIRKTGIDKNKQFILENVKIANPYPAYFIVNNEGEIILSVDEVDKLAKNIITLDCFGKDDIIKSANQYFLNRIKKDDNKSTLIYFAMEGCKDCMEAENMLCSNNVQDSYNIVTLYTDDSYGEQENVDVGRLFLEIYGIEWYPSFLILKDDTYKFVGETSIEELKKILFTDNSTIDN